jgi:choline-sulfatase
MAKAPNILFLMADQLAPQVLKAYGGPVCRTPHLDRLADEGVVFDSAYTNYPICAPARFSGKLTEIAMLYQGFKSGGDFIAGPGLL